MTYTHVLFQICFGGEVPRSLYLTQSADTANMEEALVAKGDKYKIDLVVEKPGSVLRCVK